MLGEPSHFWIAFVARSWRFREGLWTDIARGALGGSRKTGSEAGLPDLEIEGLDDLFYLPPVDLDLAGERDRLADRLTGAGTPVLLQLAPGESTAASTESGLLRVVYDLVDHLVAGESERLAELP
ncbi:MAG: hypothetical protein MI919_32605 [Holophagales bacterium]|nr:hypothetical protein [Holophagales bacterium]